MDRSNSFKAAANMIIKDARMSGWSSVLLAYSTFGIGNLEINVISKLQGGLSVGGIVSFDGYQFNFEANKINRILNIGSLDFSIPASEILSAVGKSGFISGKLNLITSKGEICFRCRGARRKALQINARELSG